MVHKKRLSKERTLESFMYQAIMAGEDSSIDTPQLWPFISYNWLFLWDEIHSINGVISTYNW